MGTGSLIQDAALLPEFRARRTDVRIRILFIILRKRPAVIAGVGKPGGGSTGGFLL